MSKTDLPEKVEKELVNKLYKNTKIDRKAMEAAKKISKIQRAVLDKLKDTWRGM